MPDPIKSAGRVLYEAGFRQNTLGQYERSPEAASYGGVAVLLVSAINQAWHWRRMERGLTEQTEILAQVPGGEYQEIPFAKVIAEIPEQRGSA